MDVLVASVEKSAKILASQGTRIIADKLIRDAADSIYDLIILPVRRTKLLLLALLTCFLK